MLTETEQRIEAIGDQLRSKINSKFQVAALLAGFAFTVLCLQVGLLWDKKLRTPLLLAASIFFMVAAIVLYVFSIMRLDALTMPKRFWNRDEKSKVPPIPSSFLWILTDQELWTLQERMICYWAYLTKIAIYCMAFSLLLLLFPYAPKADSVRYSKWLFAGSAALSVVLSGIYATWVIKKASKKGELVRIVD